MSTKTIVNYFEIFKKQSSCVVNCSWKQILQPKRVGIAFSPRYLL